MTYSRYFKQLSFRFCLVCVLTIMAWVPSSHALSPLAKETPQATVRVSIDDPIYRVIDQLVSFGLIPPPLYGVRPWSAREIDGLLARAEHAWNEQKSGAHDGLSLPDSAARVRRESRLVELFRDVDLYHVRFAPTSTIPPYSVSPLRRISVDAAFTDQDAHLIPGNNMGILSTDSAPFSEYREGKELVRGGQYRLTADSHFQLSPYMTGLVSPYLYAQFPLGDAVSDTELSWRELYTRFVFHNVALQVGRSSLVLGQGEHGGLLLTNNARPLDGIQLSNDEPFRLPFFFKYLGDTRLLFHINTLGPDYVYDHSLFSGLKMQIQPIDALELGFGYSIIFGGEQAPDAGGLDVAFQDYFGFLPIVSSTSNSTANRIVELDGRVTLKKLRGTQFYFEMALDDKTTASLKSTFTQRAGYLFGIYLPRLNDSGTWDLRVEWTWLSEILYRHSTFPYTENSDILGMPSGPDSMEAKLSLGFAINESLRLTQRFGVSARESDTYTSLGDTYIETADNPREIFLSWMPEISAELNPRTTLSFGLGVSRALNANYVSNDNETQLLGQARLSIALPELSTAR